VRFDCAPGPNGAVRFNIGTASTPHAARAVIPSLEENHRPTSAHVGRHLPTNQTYGKTMRPILSVTCNVRHWRIHAQNSVRQIGASVLSTEGTLATLTRHRSRSPNFQGLYQLSAKHRSVTPGYRGLNIHHRRVRPRDDSHALRLHAPNLYPHPVDTRARGNV
jgi:hypothetical protein